MHHSLIRTLDLILKSLAAVAAAGLTVCVLLGIASRAVNDPFGWTDLLSPFWWAIAEIFMQLGVVLFGLLVVVSAAELIERNSDVEATSVPLAMMWIYVPLALAAAVATLQALADIAGAWQARHAAAGEVAP
jgi:TRAP-type C4-dicarboxylate transport system permease small subunit